MKPTYVLTTCISCLLAACSGESSTPSVEDASSSAADAADDQSGGDDASTPDASKDVAHDTLPSNCPPCAAHYSCAVMSANPGTFMGTGVRLPGGSCMVNAMTLKCGGTGTGGNGTAITWTVESGDLWILVPNASFDCKPQ